MSSTENRTMKKIVVRRKRKPVSKSTLKDMREKQKNILKENRKVKDTEGVSNRYKSNLESSSSLNYSFPSTELDPISTDSLMSKSQKFSKEKKKAKAFNLKLAAEPDIFIISSDSSEDCKIIEEECVKTVEVAVTFMQQVYYFTLQENQTYHSVFERLAEISEEKKENLFMCCPIRRIYEDETPQEIGLENCQVIDCVVNNIRTKIQVLLQSSGLKSRKTVAVYDNEPFEKPFRDYCLEIFGKPLEEFIFKFDGERISPKDFPKDLDFDENEICIDVLPKLTV